MGGRFHFFSGLIVSAYAATGFGVVSSHVPYEDSILTLERSVTVQGGSEFTPAQKSDIAARIKSAFGDYIPSNSAMAKIMAFVPSEENVVSADANFVIRVGPVILTTTNGWNYESYAYTQVIETVSHPNVANGYSHLYDASSQNYKEFSSRCSAMNNTRRELKVSTQASCDLRFDKILLTEAGKPKIIRSNYSAQKRANGAIKPGTHNCLIVSPSATITPSINPTSKLMSYTYTCNGVINRGEAPPLTADEMVEAAKECSSQFAKQNDAFFTSMIDEAIGSIIVTGAPQPANIVRYCDCSDLRITYYEQDLTTKKITELARFGGFYKGRDECVAAMATIKECNTSQHQL